MEYKTNVMRILDREKISYTPHDYVKSGVVSGRDIAKAIGMDPARVFKTLVTVGKSKKNYVFVIPVLEELDLKRAAACVGEKAIEMIKQKELLPLTGYVHGGCSPVGMKKLFPTYIHISCREFDHIFVSAGKVGYQIELPPEELIRIAKGTTANIIIDD